MHGAAHLCVRFYQSSCWQTLAALDISHHVNHIAAQQEVAEACRRAGRARACWVARSCVALVRDGAVEWRHAWRRSTICMPPADGVFQQKESLQQCMQSSPLQGSPLQGLAGAAGAAAAPPPAPTRALLARASCRRLPHRHAATRQALVVGLLGVGGTHSVVSVACAGRSHGYLRLEDPRKTGSRAGRAGETCLRGQRVPLPCCQLPRPHLVALTMG